MGRAACRGCDYPHTVDRGPTGVWLNGSVVVRSHPPSRTGPGRQNRIFAAVDDAAFERLTRTWIDALERAGSMQADLLHLHHLTPANEAAARAFGSVPVLGQVHAALVAGATDHQERSAAAGEPRPRAAITAGRPSSAASPSSTTSSPLPKADCTKAAQVTTGP